MEVIILQHTRAYRTYLAPFLGLLPAFQCSTQKAYMIEMGQRIRTYYDYTVTYHWYLYPSPQAHPEI